MNHRMIRYTLGKLLTLEGVLLLLPTLVSLLYRENATLMAFGGTAVGTLVLSLLLTAFSRTKNKTIYAREGFFIVALAWILLSAIGAIPFVLSGDIPSYMDAFFETVSGFTTTGASVVPDVESLSRGALFWRSFTHWIGGMGVLVLMMAIIPDNTGRSIHIMRAEMPGPSVDKIVPRVRDTAKILYLIYIVLTAAEFVLLLFDMTPFDALLHTFGTAGTGGFGVRGDSMGSYSAYSQWVITVFMLIFGVNFNLYYLLLIRRFRSALKSEEFWVYFAITGVSVCAIAVNILPLFDRAGDALRHSAFQVASILTTTGYSSTDFNLWPGFSKGILLLLMFVGGCAGSTAGGLKVSRVIMLAKSIRRELNLLLHPRAVSAVTFEGKPLDAEKRSGVSIYFALYILVFGVLFLLVSLEPFDLETTFTAAAACFNNVGPGFSLAGPLSSYADFSVFSKFLLSAAMLFGRLEIYPLILLLIPARGSSYARRG